MGVLLYWAELGVVSINHDAEYIGIGDARMPIWSVSNLAVLDMGFVIADQPVNIELQYCYTVRGMLSPGCDPVAVQEQDLDHDQRCSSASYVWIGWPTEGEGKGMQQC